MNTLNKISETEFHNMSNKELGSIWDSICPNTYRDYCEDDTTPEEMKDDLKRFLVKSGDLISDCMFNLRIEKINELKIKVSMLHSEVENITGTMINQRLFTFMLKDVEDLISELAV